MSWSLPRPSGGDRFLTNLITTITRHLDKLDRIKPTKEFGEWTPVLSDGTNDANMGAQNYGEYVRHGDLVFIHGRCHVSSKGSITNGLRITGLPYSARTHGFNYMGISSHFCNGLSAGAAGYSVCGNIEDGDSYINLELWDSTGGSTTLQASEVTGSFSLMFSGHYRVET